MAIHHLQGDESVSPHKNSECPIQEWLPQQKS